jgi:hypothetical protein
MSASRSWGRCAPQAPRWEPSLGEKQTSASAHATVALALPRTPLWFCVSAAHALPHTPRQFCFSSEEKVYFPPPRARIARGTP